MTRGREFIAVLLFATAFLITQLDPISLDFSWSSVLGLLFVAVFGALTTVGGMIEVRWHYIVPILALAILDLSAIGLFFFAALGVKAADHEEENMINPNIVMINNATFSSYSLFVLAAVIATFPLIEFGIPDVVSGYAVELLAPSVGCDLDYTGQECIDVLVNEDIDRACEGESTCITVLNQNRPELEEAKAGELAASFIGFGTEKEMRGVLQETLQAQIRVMIEPYADIFKFLMAFVIFTVFQVLASPLTVAAALICKVLIIFMEKSNLLTKETIKVEKLRFSA